jgi:alpha-mannosidase
MSTPGQVELMAVRDARQEQCDVEGGTGSDTGTHRIEWLLAPASSPLQAEQAAQAFNRPIDLEVVPLTQASTLDLPRQQSLLDVSGAGVVSALKPADRGGGVILRALLTPGPVTVTLPTALVGTHITQVDLAERDGASRGTAGRTLTLDKATYGSIASVRLQ